MGVIKSGTNRRIVSFMLTCIMTLSLVLSIAGQGTVVAYASQTGTITGSGVRVRSTPTTSVSNNILTSLYVGDPVDILETDIADSSGGALVWTKVSFTKDGTFYEGYVASQYVKINEDIGYDPEKFEEWLEEQEFPEDYRVKLRMLHAQYPEWIFVADHLDYTWEEVVEAQTLYGRSLVAASDLSSWKSIDDKAYNWPEDKWYGYDGGKWNIASREIVEFALDPRNYLDSTRIFAFELLSYNEGVHNEAGVQSIIANSFMKAPGLIGDKTLLVDASGKAYTYPGALMLAGSTSKVSPYHLATRIIQEVSIGTDRASDSVTGTVSGYEGLYNYYNIKAYEANGNGPIVNGLIYAREKGWTSRLKAIIEGAQSTLGENYIAIGQDTLYYEKFDFVGTPYTHQYMTYVIAPYSEAATAGKAYSEEMRQTTALSFKIPVFKDMPEDVAPKPTKTGSPNNILAHMEVVGVTMSPAYNYTVTSYSAIVPFSTSKVNVYAKANAGTATVTGDGWQELKVGMNTIEVVCTAENGDERTYTIQIYREAPEGDEGEIYENGLVYDSASGNWYYYIDYAIATGFTGLVQRDGIWWYVNRGVLDMSYTGPVVNGGYTWYVLNGKLIVDYTGIRKNGTDFWYVDNGKIKTEFVGLRQSNGCWWYVVNGKIQTGYTGFVDYSGYRWFVSGGKVDTGYTGLRKGSDGVFYCVQGGKVNLTYSGLVQSSGSWWYVINGVLDTSVTGICETGGERWFIATGKLQSGYTDTLLYGGVTYTIVNGKVTASN